MMILSHTLIGNIEYIASHHVTRGFAPARTFGGNSGNSGDRHAPGRETRGDAQLHMNMYIIINDVVNAFDPHRTSMT